MLTSISPVGEATRGQRWWLTAVAYLVGAVLGGSLLGLALGSLGRATLAGLEEPTRLGILAVAIVVAGALEARDVTLPSWQRQVDERWLDRYRGWVYGLGFGFQLGTGVMTIASSNLLHAMLLALLLIAEPAAGTLVGLGYGTARALPLLASGLARSPAALRTVMRRLSRVEKVLPMSVAGVLVTTGVASWLLR